MSNKEPYREVYFILLLESILPLSEIVRSFIEDISK